MQDLEKILEEIREIGNIQFSSYTKPLIAVEDAEKIIRKHMNDGWIPVEDKLPKRTLDEKINNLYKKYLVFIDSVDGWDIDMAVYDFWNDKKWRTAHDGYEEIENVVAWCPLPEPYRPERSNKE